MHTYNIKYIHYCIIHYFHDCCTAAVLAVEVVEFLTTCGKVFGMAAGPLKLNLGGALEPLVGILQKVSFCFCIFS